MWIESAEPSDPHPASIRPASLLHLRQGGLIPGHGPVPLILVNRPAARTVAPYGNQINTKTLRSGLSLRQLTVFASGIPPAPQHYCVANPVRCTPASPCLCAPHRAKAATPPAFYQAPQNSACEIRPIFEDHVRTIAAIRCSAPHP